LSLDFTTQNIETGEG